MTKDLIIAIDGPSGAGKSTVARSVASRLGYLYLESGALYRAMAWKVIHEEVDPENIEALKSLCHRTEISIRNLQGQPRILVNQKDVTNELKTPLLDRVSSQISAVAPVRERLLHLQRQMGRQGGVVIEGRDIGSVVFPDADLKFYLDAATEVRARRRHDELKAIGYNVTLASVWEEIQLRDQRDIERNLAPLKRPEDAIYIDTTHLTLDQVVDTMVGEIKGRIQV
ncbi:MAG: (d)CMP kinase [Nitrospira sp.]|nr:(d)CMP kinase [Nitrospira sp.]